MSEIHLKDLSKIYNDQIAEKKKDDTYLEPDMKKRQANNEKARKELAKGPQMKNPHFEALDPVGQEDGDIDNDGDKDKSDKYLAKRRKAIGNAIKGKMKKEDFIPEVMSDSMDDKPIKEKKVKNIIKVNPKLGESVEEIGGELIEAIEIFVTASPLGRRRVSGSRPTLPTMITLLTDAIFVSRRKVCCTEIDRIKLVS